MQILENLLEITIYLDETGLLITQTNPEDPADRIFIATQHLELFSKLLNTELESNHG